MKRTNIKLVSFCFFYSVFNVFVIKQQYHIDEKRNVKQPPLLRLLSNFVVKFYSEQLTVVRLS
jgi:hypothetical protein